jgi:hypothetical protein
MNHMSQLYSGPPQSTVKMQSLDIDMKLMTPFTISCQAIKTYLKNNVGVVAGSIPD